MNEHLSRLLTEARTGDASALDELAVELRRLGYGYPIEPWEYDVIDIPTQHSPRRHAELLSAHGALGWKLSHCYSDEGYTFYVMRRRPTPRP